MIIFVLLKRFTNAPLESVGSFEMNKILSRHIFKPEEVSGTPSQTPELSESSNNKETSGVKRELSSAQSNTYVSSSEEE